ncbi:MAG: hypothetical protein BGO78_01425 [Chloroflexi bacterium 44-23]|nr:MAG: hypothetical protein BGO78_01425 [Chloroflexi bacterium 44-23]
MDSIPTISAVCEQYLRTIQFARSENTYKTYRNGLNLFLKMLAEKKIDISTMNISFLSDEQFAAFIAYLKYQSPATERLYLTSVKAFYEYITSEKLAEINLVRIQLLIKQRSRKAGVRLPQFPKSEIDVVLEKADQLSNLHTDGEVERLINYRDRAFLFCLADTGLRVHEACKLRRGDINWFELRAIVIGKGNREAVVRFSERSIQKIKEYINLRAELDGATGISLSALPIFARHDKGAGKKITPITTTTGRNIVTARVVEFLGQSAAGTITPHSFRHYFVTRILQASGNLKLAQSLARHTNIAVTQRYAHINDDELDRGYKDIFK